MNAAWLVGAAVLVAPTIVIAAPGTMTVAEFLTKADKLKATGMAAMFSSDLKPLMTEMTSAAKSYRIDARAAGGAGRADLGCPPAQGKFGVKSDEILAEFASMPSADRGRTTAKAAFYAMMKRKFPCP